MEWKNLLAPKALDFIKAHENADVAALALQKAPDCGVDYPVLLSQIKARRRARRKVPDWFSKGEDLLFPGPDIVEQASSQATALYKTTLISGARFIDIAAGLGVDGWALSKNFEHGVCVERDVIASELLAHNFKVLGCDNLRVVNASAEDFIPSMASVTLVYADPQRRDDVRKGKFRLEDCSPGILSLLPILKHKAQFILLKTSPMLDIDATVKALGCVTQVHVLEHAGDCKEVLYFMEPHTPSDVQIKAVSLDDNGKVLREFSFTEAEEAGALAPLSAPMRYLYEPGPAFMKAGGYNMMALRYNLAKLHPDTHLYTGDALLSDFPGRVFEVRGLYPVRAGKIPLERASITVRNFPGSAEELRRKLKLKDGGADTLFACTLASGERALIHAIKPQ